MAQNAGPLPEVSDSPIGYPSVAAALADLAGRPDVQTSVQGDWTIIAQPQPRTLWSFPGAKHPAYPAAVRREVVTGPDGKVYVQMQVLCEASKPACDDLVRSFQALNKKIGASGKRRS
ncbi:molecular chaperone DnaJ [Caulobacter vibrioides]|uniref:molecular chaperone DnaJ n=1 Tax=Caulobacter vibrioides TaxID=155892 RepID=UPI0015E702FE|nr:molecular chaperone DnaJ [Caulobacter vibrioides]